MELLEVLNGSVVPMNYLGLVQRGAFHMYRSNLMQIQKHLLFLLIDDDASLDLSVVRMIGGAAREICFNQ